MKVVLADNLTIQVLHDDGSWLYEIDVERCRNSAETLDWLYQVLYKSWCSPQVIFDVMWALEQACQKYHRESVQGTFCGLGIDRRVKWPFGGAYVDGT
jgi:hypothetical protein